MSVRTQRRLLTEVGGFSSHQWKCVYFYLIGSVYVCWNSSERASCGVVLQMPGGTGEPRPTAPVLCMMLGGGSSQHDVILTTLSVTSFVSPMPPPKSISQSISWNGPASPYSAPSQGHMSVALIVTSGYTLTKSALCHITLSRKWCNSPGLLPHTHTHFYVLWCAYDSHPHGQKTIKKSLLCAIEQPQTFILYILKMR